MHYIMTFIWSVLLVSMLNYVVSSVLGADFVFSTGLYLSVAVTIFVFIASAIIPNEAVAESTPDQH